MLGGVSVDVLRCPFFLLHRYQFRFALLLSFGYPPAVQIDVNAAYVRFCVESGGASSRLSKSDHSCTRGYGKGHRSLSWDARMLAGLGTEVSSEATDGQTGRIQGQ